MNTKAFRLDYIDRYIANILTDKDYLRFGGANEIASGLRILIDKFPKGKKFNMLAEATIVHIAKYGDNLSAYELLYALRKFA